MKNIKTKQKKSYHVPSLALPEKSVRAGAVSARLARACPPPARGPHTANPKDPRRRSHVQTTQHANRVAESKTTGSQRSSFRVGAVSPVIDSVKVKRTGTESVAPAPNGRLMFRDIWGWPVAWMDGRGDAPPSADPAPTNPSSVADRNRNGFVASRSF